MGHDPYMRARMEAVKSYAPHLNVGDVIVGQGICEVLASRRPDFKAGDKPPRSLIVRHPTPETWKC